MTLSYIFIPFMNFLQLFSINTTLFTFMGYPMSYIEFVGTLLNIWSVWLVAKKKTLNWPVGIVAVLLFLLLFYQIQLYSDFIEQIYFLITGFYGWWVWKKTDDKKDSETVDLHVSSSSQRIFYLATILFGTIVMGYFMSNIHNYFPTFFTVPAAFPYLDAFTTVMSFVATILLIYKKVDSWAIWILVDVIGIVLYYVRGVKFISLLYIIFLILATKGFINWYQLWKKQHAIH